MLTPKECFEKIKDVSYFEKNFDFLKPIYAQLYRELGKEIVYDKDLHEEVRIIKQFFKEAFAIKIKFKLDKSDTQKLGDLLIQSGILPNTIKSFQNALRIIREKRSNINGIEPFMWLILGGSGIDKIGELTGAPSLIKERLLCSELLSTILNTNYLFFEITLNDVLSPFELINPTRRKGSFDKRVFSTIAKDLNLSMKFCRNSTNWLIDETEVKKNLKFSLPPGVKYPDFICKIKKIGFVGAHKEQNCGGGAQDNQAEDAKRVFLFNESPYEQKSLDLLDVEKIKTVIIYDSYSRELRTGRHWNSIYELVQKNENNYLVNSVIFTELLKSC